MLAQQLNELALSGAGGRGSNGARLAPSQRLNGAQPRPPAASEIVGSDSDEDDGLIQNDGTLLASDPPRPLPPDGYNQETLRCLASEDPLCQAPNRPLPPTPDEEEGRNDATLVMRRIPSNSSSSNEQRHSSSAVKNDHGKVPAANSATAAAAAAPTSGSRRSEEHPRRSTHSQQQQQHRPKERPRESKGRRKESSASATTAAEVSGRQEVRRPTERKHSQQLPDRADRNPAAVAEWLMKHSGSPAVRSSLNSSAGTPSAERLSRREGADTTNSSGDAALLREETSSKGNHDDRLGRSDLSQSSSGNLSNARSSGELPDLLPRHAQQRQQDKSTSDEYRQALNPPAPPQLQLQQKQRSFLAFGFSAGGGSTAGGGAPPAPSPRRESHVNVNVTPTSHEAVSTTPEIRKYKKRFYSEILCAALWGVNLLIGTENGLMLLDRSGQGKVYQLISRRRFQQMEVLEGQNILVTISGKKQRVRVYYLSWLKSKILRTDAQVEKRNGWINVGDLHGAVHFKIVKYERIKFLVIALRDSIEIYAWAPKPYHKFMAFKSFPELIHKPLVVDMTIEENIRLKVVYGSSQGFHAVDLDSGAVYDVYIPSHNQGQITPHTIVTLPNSKGVQLLLCYDNEGVYVSIYGRVSKNIVLQWGEMPTSVAYVGTGQIMGWGNKAIEIRSVESGHLDGVFMHKKSQKLKFLCERNDKVFFSSAKGGTSCQIYFMTLNKPGMANW